MRRRKKRRLYLVLTCLLCFGGATALSLAAFSSSLTYFLSPRQVEAKPPPAGELFRLGGIVQVGTISTMIHNGTPVTSFMVTDGSAAVKVVYAGILPDLFRAGQGVVVVGALQRNGLFSASDVLAKHGADYMPRDVEEALKNSGKWNPAFGPPPPAQNWNEMSVKGAGT